MHQDTKQIKISDITIGPRHRKDMGDLDSLAQAIQEVGLLQPIGVTPRPELVFGERRLRACRDILGWESLPARVIDIPAIALGEYHENCDRKDFTPSELVAIVESLRGYRHGGDRKSDQFRNSDDDRKTLDDARELFGLKKDTYCRAKRVVDQGVPELVEAMDSGKISVYAASEIAHAEPEEQLAFLGPRSREEQWTGFGVKRHLRLLRSEKRRAASDQLAVSMPNDADAVRIYHCPFKQLEELAGLSPASVKLVCTDIPYGQEFLPQVEELAALAKRVLVPGGLFVSYLGQFRLNEKLAALDKYLTYQWLCSSVWVKKGNFVPHLTMVSKSIPIAIYSNGDWKPTRKWCDTFHVEGREKDWHEWQRPLEEVEKIVQYFSQPGDLVVDPCGGGFTTAIACHRLGRRFVGCDIDKAAVAQGQERLTKERESATPPTIKIGALRANTVNHGDCIDLIPGLPDGSVNLCLTSPPYAEQRKNQYASIPEAAYPEFTLRWMAALTPKLTDDGSVLIVIDPHVENGVMADYVLRTALLLREHGWKQHRTLKWYKPDVIPLGHKSWPRHCYEDILWFSRSSRPYCDPSGCGKRTSHLSANRYAHSEWSSGGKEQKDGIARITDVVIAHVGSNEKGVDHPARFPLTLVEQLIPTFCPEGGTVLDPFAGSGTTLIAAANLRRNWYGVDISGEYCDLARQRLRQREEGLSQAG